MVVLAGDEAPETLDRGIANTRFVDAHFGSSNSAEWPNQPRKQVS
jgi:hypothetical protein